MLLPALSKARERARQAVCVSNLKQIGIAFYMYIDDYDGYFPRAVYGWSGQYMAHWHVLFLRLGYLKRKSPTSTYLSRKDFQPLICPSAPNLRKPSTDLYSIPGWDYRYISYGYNISFIGGSSGVGGSLYQPAKLSQIKKPSKTILLADSLAVYYTGGPSGTVSSYDAGYFTLYPSAKNAGVTGVPHARHSRVVNVLWCDGHVSSHNAPSRQIYSDAPEWECYHPSCLGDIWRCPEPGEKSWWDRD
ncbi:MAG: DUF1559 domain-containing protein [Candidatus Omnitrophica bacterium]|nr:DUF1559 domain-containing protein [Candidatus Omnitrophota bacterium]